MRALACMTLICLLASACVREPLAPGEAGARCPGRVASAPGSSQFRDACYVSYAVDPARLVRYISPKYELLTRDTVKGRKAFLCIVWFRHEGLRAHVPLSPVVDAGEVNIRTYVRHKATGEEGIWFLDVVLSPPVGTLFAIGTAMHARSEACCVRRRRRADGLCLYSWSGGACEPRLGCAQGLGHRGTAPEGFASVQDAVTFLVERHVGYYDRTLPGFPVGRMEIQHKPMAVTAGHLLRARFPRAVAMGVLDEAQVDRPHSVYVTPGAKFTAHVTYGHQR